MKFPINGQNLIDLIPQKPPFVLISALLEVSEGHSVTSFVFDQNHVLCEDGKLTTGGVMENIAQTAAAKTGYQSFMKGKKVPIGFIGDVRDFTCTRLPKIGEELTTEIRISNKIFDVTLITGTVKLNGEQIASCKMKIFEEPEAKTAESNV